MRKIVIDADLLVSAFISPEGASRQLLLDALNGECRIRKNSIPLIMAEKA